jgi:site-specific DNA-cytosine methylase
MKHASIIPLIGGMTLGAEKTFGTKPEYLISYSPFYNNDSHLISHYDNEVPYYAIDKTSIPKAKVEVINTTCPCAGLSQLSHGFGDHNVNNKWMIESTQYVLNELKPEVLYGENAPGFAGKIGATIRNEMYKIGREAGYSMTVYRTKSLLHGNAQIRERSFYFFWKGDKTPVLEYYNRPRVTIEDVITGAKGNTQREPINEKIPSVDDPYYRYILERMHNGLTHAQFCNMIEPSSARGNDTYSYIEKHGHTYVQVAEWMKNNGYEKEVSKCEYKQNKLNQGQNIMRRGTVFPRDYIGAFVGHYPMMLVHPIEDRYINYREAMTIMGMPDNFQLVNAGKKNVNMICQNVPVQTAADMANEVKEYLAGNRNTINSTLTFQYNHTKTITAETNNITHFFS